MVSVEAYSGQKAADYAKKYAKNYNASYPGYDSDCTNFASQCVKAGGVTGDSLPTGVIKYNHINSVYKTKDYWSCGKYTRTTTVAGIKIMSKTGFVATSTWTVVSKKSDASFWGLYNYMTKKSKCTAKEYAVNTEAKLNTFIKDCKVGDVLQIRSSSDSTKWHSVIVTEHTYNSKTQLYNMKIAYHTTDTSPTDFRSISWKKFGTDKLWTVLRFK